MTVDVDFSIYPPGLVLMVFEFTDQLWNLLYFEKFFGDWRSFFGSGNSWFDPKFKCPPVMDSMPDLLSYQDYASQSSDTSLLTSLYNYGFKTNSTKLGDVTSYESMIVLLVLIIALRLFKMMVVPQFSSLGRMLGRREHGLEWEKENQIRIVKFGEYVFRLCFHFAIATYSILYFANKPWWKQQPYSGEEEAGTKTLWSNFPNDDIEPKMIWYYLIQCAYNLDAMISLVVLSCTVQTRPFQIRWSETVRGDFREMLVHHLVTNALVVGSSKYRLTRVGSMVFMVHDISDVPVDLSKLANFMKWKMATGICFGSMVVVWLVFRLSVLPLVIYKSVLFESILMLKNNIDPKLFLAYWYFFVILLGVIILLHATWFTMFIKMGYYLLVKGERHDFTEHKKGENLQQTPTKKEQ